jgi:hypothetical protein
MVTSTKELSRLEGELLSCIINSPRTHGSHTDLHKSERPFSNEFQASVTTDLTPLGSVCDWCGQAAERRFTALGGCCHNKTGVFCSACGQLFVEKVVKSSARGQLYLETIVNS